MRLLVTDAAAQPPRQATAWLIMTFGKVMKSCPECGSELSEGVVTVKGLTPQFFMPIFSDKDLWFVRKSGKKKKIVPSAEQRRAFLCDSCGTVCIVPDPARPAPDLSDLAGRLAARFRAPKKKKDPKA